MKKMAILSLTFLVLWGCATFSQDYKLGTQAAVNKNWEEAIRHYEKAVQEDPDNSVYRLALLRARMGASLAHVQKARNLAAAGKKEEALAEYRTALSYDPGNRTIIAEARRLASEEPEKEEREETEIEPPVKLQVGQEKLRLNFVHDRVMLKSIFEALGKHAQVNILFDEQFKNIPFSVDLTDRTFEQALDSLCMATKNFYRVIDEKTVIIVPDLPAKRVQYELNAIKTFYLSNIKAEDISATLMQMLRSQFMAPQIMVDKHLNAVTVRATPEVLELAGKLVRNWDKPKGEVVIDLEIMEVSRIKLKQYGIAFDQYMAGLGYSGGENPPTESGWFDLSKLDFGKAENFQISLPTSLLRFLESDDDTKIISQPRLRGIEGEEINYLVGDKVPIPRTSFTPIAAGGVASQPLTSFEFEDVGIDITITPTIHYEGEITLELEINIKAIGGTGVADIPIISTREVKNIIRLKDGETNLLAGLLKDEERLSARGILGLKNIPLLGNLFSSTEKTIQQTDVILTITPYILRTTPVSDRDRRPIWVNLTRTSTGRAAAEVMGEKEREEMERRIPRPGVQEAREGENRLFLNPANFEITEGREFRMNVTMRSSEAVSAMSLGISFNPAVLKLKQVLQGNMAAQMGKEAPFLQSIDNASGACTIGISSTDMAKGYKGSGRVAILVFDAIGKGDSPISFSTVSATSPSGNAVIFTSTGGRVRVR